VGILDDAIKLKPADWILITSICMFFLEVTGGAWGMTVAAGQDDHPLVIGGLLLLVWVGLRFHPTTTTPLPPSHVQLGFIAQIKERISFDDAKGLHCSDDELPIDELRLTNKAQRLMVGVQSGNLKLTVEGGIHWLSPIDT